MGHGDRCLTLSRIFCVIDVIIGDKASIKLAEIYSGYAAGPRIIGIALRAPRNIFGVFSIKGL